MRAEHRNSPQGSGKKNYYSLLGVASDATVEEIKKAHKRMALRWHPDKADDKKEECEEIFKAIQEAWELLKDEEKREIYDYGKRKPTPIEMKPLPKRLIELGYTVRKGDGLSTCMCCGFKAEREYDKRVHIHM